MAKMALGSRPKTDYEKKLVGLVDVVTGKTKAKFTLTEDGKTFKNGETSITANFDDLPARPKLKPEVKEPKQYRVRMSQDGSEIEAITPAMGHFHAKLVDLGKRDDEDADPVPFEKIFGEGTPKENSHLEFFAVYEITEGAFKGVQLPAYYLHYKFEEDPDNEGFTRFAGNFENKKAVRLFQLKEWGDAHGLWNEPIEWDDVTILPVLLERALENDRLVDLTIKDGYIRELLPVQTEDDEEEETIDPLTDKPDFLDDGIEDVQLRVHSAGKKSKYEDDLDEAIETYSQTSKKSNGKTALKSSAKKFVKKVSKKSSDEDDDL